MNATQPQTYRQLFDPNWAPVFVLDEISIADVARGVGMGRSSVSKIFSGKRNPSVQSLSSIADCLSRLSGRKVSMDDVMRLIKEKPWLRR